MEYETVLVVVWKFLVHIYHCNKIFINNLKFQDDYLNTIMDSLDKDEKEEIKNYQEMYKDFKHSYDLVMNI